MTIGKLKKKDIDEAVKVYLKGLSMEIPKGYSTKEDAKRKLNGINSFVYKEGGKILGLITFTLEYKKKIKINFICAIKPRKRIGKKLMKKLAKFAIKNKIKMIQSTMSSKDKRATNFYEKCGFRKYGKDISNNFVLYRIKVKPEEILIG